LQGCGRPLGSLEFRSREKTLANPILGSTSMANSVMFGRAIDVESVGRALQRRVQ
jgi:hypothetical protein